MIEYEYSFKVKDIIPYINYCIENNYKKTLENKQLRNLYTNNNKVLARVTTDIVKDKESTYLDFKDEDNTSVVLKKSRETIPLVVDEDNKESIMSILEIMDYKLKKELVRKRVVYELNNVKFELDEYSSPSIFFVVAIEGAKEEVDRVYNILKEKIIEK